MVTILVIGVKENFNRPHGIRIDKDDNLYLIDDLDHIVQKEQDQEKYYLLLERKVSLHLGKKEVILIDLLMLLLTNLLVIFLFQMVMGIQGFISLIRKEIT